MQTEIPLYKHEGELCDWITPARLARLEKLDLIQIVRHEKEHVSRYILRQRPREPAPMKIAYCTGKPYSYEQRLDGGNRCCRLKSLTGTRSETNLAPEALRPLFLEAGNGPETGQHQEA